MTGLTNKEAGEILSRDGFNELPSQKSKGFFGLLIEVLKEPMLLLLLVCGLIYLFLGEIKDALVLSVAVFVVIAITFYQERKTNKALDALKNLSSPRALVIRDGEQIRIPGREVVIGDVVIIREGDRVPADAIVLEVNNLSTDESLLTGESFPVRKIAGDENCEFHKPGGDNLPFVFSGTLVTQGHGLCKVIATGINTQMGIIGKALDSIEDSQTLLKKEVNKIVKVLTFTGLLVCAIVLVIYGISTGNWIEAFLAGLTLNMAMLPEEFPVVLTIFLALGAWRISKRNVLTRNAAAIETLGAATTLCVDKTGTITQNKMQLTSINNNSERFDLPASDETIPEKYHEILIHSILSSQQDPFDPIEKAIHETGRVLITKNDLTSDKWELKKEYPLTEKVLAITRVWKNSQEENLIVSAKGAPEAIAKLCKIDEKELISLHEEVKAMTMQGLRVLAVAKGIWQDENLPEHHHELNYELLGLIGFVDPLREEVNASVQECYKAGIRVVMITGDYPNTAQTIAENVGLQNSHMTMTGDELEKICEDELPSKIANINVFARVVPTQKLNIVNALKRNNEIVAMTGDGVNDAPALKAAHIGIAMGQRGTDVAREASDIVLLDDDFSSIVHAIELGRTIYDNLRKAMMYIFSIHIPIAGLALIPAVLGYPIMLMPAHIAFLELVIDPSCSIVFESQKSEKSVMLRKPRRLGESMFSRGMIFLSAVQGSSILVSVIFVFLYSSWRNDSIEMTRTLSFISLVMGNAALIITNLSWESNFIQTILGKNKALIGVMLMNLVMMALILNIPFLYNLFYFTKIGVQDLILPTIATVVVIAWFEILKIVQRLRMKV